MTDWRRVWRGGGAPHVEMWEPVPNPVKGPQLKSPLNKDRIKKKKKPTSLFQNPPTRLLYLHHPSERPPHPYFPSLQK